MAKRETTATPRKSKPQDATMRNVRSADTRLDELEHRVRKLEKRIKKLRKG